MCSACSKNEQNHGRAEPRPVGEPTTMSGNGTWHSCGFLCSLELLGGCPPSTLEATWFLPSQKERKGEAHWHKDIFTQNKPRPFQSGAAFMK